MWPEEDKFTGDLSATAPSSDASEVELGKALLFAQQLADETVEDARRQAAKILDDARAESLQLQAADVAVRSRRDDTPARPTTVEQQIAALEFQLREELDLVARTVEAVRRRMDSGFEILRGRLTSPSEDGATEHATRIDPRTSPSLSTSTLPSLNGAVRVEVRDRTMPSRSFGDLPSFD